VKEGQKEKVQSQQKVLTDFVFFVGAMVLNFCSCIFSGAEGQGREVWKLYTDFQGKGGA
jgi:hypothetical protein